MINFPFGTNGKSIILGVPILKHITVFEIGEGEGSRRRGVGSAFHILCPRYDGLLIPTAHTATRLREPLPVLPSFALKSNEQI